MPDLATSDHPPAAPDDATAPGPSRVRQLLALGAATVVVLGVLLVVFSHDGGQEKLPRGAHRATSPTFIGSTLSPVSPAPQIALRNSLGERVTLSRYRGKVVLVTFLYTHCPDVCPLIATHLRALQTRLGAEAQDVPLISVSVDPRGDTPRTVATFLREHQLTGRMQYLLGTPAQLGRTWAAWNVGSRKDAGDPEFVAHSALVYGVGASGRLLTIYPANFKPADLAHDIPLLAER